VGGGNATLGKCGGINCRLGAGPQWAGPGRRGMYSALGGGRWRGQVGARSTCKGVPHKGVGGLRRLPISFIRAGQW